MAQSMSDTYEYVVTKKVEGSYKTKRILIIVAYITYILALVAVCSIIRIPQLIALAPVTMWMIAYFSWPYFSIEYEYVLMEGQITFSEILGGRKRRERFSLRISSLDAIMPYKSENDKDLLAYGAEKEYIALSSEKNAVDPYFALFKDDSGKKCVFFFEATNRSLRILKYYNPVTVMSTLSK